MQDVTPTREPLLTSEDLAELSRGGDGHEINYPVGSTLMLRGNNDSFVLYLLSGHVKSVRKSLTGKRTAQIVGLHGPGDVVGEMAAVTGQPRTADVVAMTDVRAQYINGDTWIDFLGRNNRVTLALYRRSEMHRTNMTAQLADSDVTADEKVANALVRLADSGMGTTEGDDLTIRGVDQHDLAALAGISLALAAQVLSRFRSQGLMTTSRRRLTICNLAQLRAISARRAAGT